ncbi:MAG TPA: hypothetical protein VIH57_10385 [Bacteroidales bacterium]
MKKMMLIALLIAVPVGLFCQDYVPTKDDLARFPKTKTLVVLEDNPLSEYNLVLKEVMPLEWTMTPYDFISWKEFETKRTDPAFSFIVMSQVKYDKDKSNAKYNFMSLLMGGNYVTINNMPDLCPLPLSYYGVGDDDYSYKLGIFIRFIQKHVKLLMDNPGLAGENILKYYNKNVSDMKGKTLYLVASEMAKDVNTIPKIKKVYSGNVKLVSKDEVKQAIADKLDIVFLHKVGPESTKFKSRCYKILIGAADANFYYFDYHIVDDDTPDGFLAKDFKKLPKN